MTNITPPAAAHAPGSSAKSAVAVPSLWAEYLWLQEHHAGWTVVRHAVVYEDEKPFDVLTIQSPQGETRDVCFAGRFTGRPPGPPCPHCGNLLISPKARQCGWCFTDFHDPSNVVYRRGRAYVDQVRSMHASWEASETRQLELRDPRAVFDALYRPRRVTGDVVVLGFPDSPGEEDTRTFQIGIELLVADGCRGVIWDLGRCRGDTHLADTVDSRGEELRPLGELLVRLRIIRIAGSGVVFLRGDHILELWGKSGIWALPPENCETEEAAIAALRSVCNDSQPDDVV